MDTNENEHTPGPWKATRTDPTRGADIWWITANHERNMETEICEIIGGPAHAPSNARLIAASPDLLEEMREILALAEEHDWIPERFQELIASRARTAIAKAEGRA